MIIVGAAYASYSALHFIWQRQIVNEIKPVASKPVVIDKKKQLIWEERPTQGEHFADLIIPNLNAQIPIIEGTNEDELEQGIGHYAGSVLPGEHDNSVLSGHRDTVFRRIGELKVGDEIHVRAQQDTFVYRITKTWITKPDDRTVIVSHDEPILTLTTCYPFQYVGTAPERYIIQSKLVTSK
ncbi:class D sortase [Hazenella sp. IB182357]|uniref:Class D sortase n=2 Tax=Polycladospora coralii TaxID=2771432 RepID=A0A926RT39_9BACL|nr:class D sortase [Polycladospora coralii]MBS7529771.1 class D sortase [Polycladospora coralii]